MRPDPGLDTLERLQREKTPAQRALLGVELRRRGFLLVWDQLDRAGPMSVVEQGMFLLSRLYPDMPEPHRRSIRRQLEVDHAAGTWRGFERPSETPAG